MPDAYNPPILSELWKAINDAEYTYSRHIGRYVIPATKGEASKPTSLQTLIIRTNKIEDCESDRISQKEVFSKLTSELRGLLALDSKEVGDEIWCQQENATQILLGALLHRYFRLIAEYTNGVSSMLLTGLSIFAPRVVRSVSPDIRTCKLFKSIRSALDLPDEMRESFLADDLLKLDAVTTCTALTSFKNYMKSGDHFKAFPHLNNPKFFIQLEEIITKESEERNGAFLLKQLQSIAFLRSLVKRLSDQHGEWVKAVSTWIEQLTKDYPHLESISIQTIEEHIQTHAAPLFKKKIADAFCTPRVLGDEIAGVDYEEYCTKPIPSLTHATLFTGIRDVNSNTASYIIMGACALILANPGLNLTTLPPTLSTKTVTTTIYKILGIEATPGSFTNKEKKIGIQFLSAFNDEELGNTDLESKVKISGLDFQFFGDVYGFQTQLSQLLEKLHLPSPKRVEYAASMGAF